MTSMDRLARDIATIMTLATRDEEYEYIYHIEGGVDREAILKTVVAVLRRRRLPFVKIIQTPPIKITEISQKLPIKISEIIEYIEKLPTKDERIILYIPFRGRGSLYIYIEEGKIIFKRILGQEIEPEWM